MGYRGLLADWSNGCLLGGRCGVQAGGRNGLRTKCDLGPAFSPAAASSLGLTVIQLLRKTIKHAGGLRA